MLISLENIKIIANSQNDYINFDAKSNAAIIHGKDFTVVHFVAFTLIHSYNWCIHVEDGVIHN